MVRLREIIRKSVFSPSRIFICVKILLLPPDFEIENVPNNARIKTLQDVPPRFISAKISRRRNTKP